MFYVCHVGNHRMLYTMAKKAQSHFLKHKIHLPLSYQLKLGILSFLYNLIQGTDVPHHVQVIHVLFGRAVVRAITSQNFAFCYHLHCSLLSSFFLNGKPQPCLDMILKVRPHYVVEHYPVKILAFKLCK